MKIRTRYAPSPTGRMHVGNLRTALYEFLIAKHAGGDFILRIEDTDRERYVEGAVDIIYRTMAETGLAHDEGPDKDGGCGPYVQSERVASGLYLDYAKQLIEKGEAYYCFCDAERLAALRQTEGSEGKEITRYDKHCLRLSKEEIEANLAAGRPYVIRQNIPEEGTTSFTDAIYGEITVENSELDDMILIKSDGYPTYNFANVIDDHLMGITHVVRGNEYLSSTPKYTRLYAAFGWEEPVYIHCPLITNEEHQKLSKRSGHSSFEDLIEQGFVTEAVVNFIALLGWSPVSNQEIFSLEELIREFDYTHISKSPAVFDMTKLRWMNGEYIKAMDNERYYELSLPYIKGVLFGEAGEISGGTNEPSNVPFALPDEKLKARLEQNITKIADLVKTRIEVFPDIAEKIDFFAALPDYDAAMYTHKKMKTNSEIALSVLEDALPVFEALDDYSFSAIEKTCMDLVAKRECKNGVVLWPLRTAVSGKQMTPGGAYEIMEILGKEESLNRIRRGIKLLKASL